MRSTPPKRSSSPTTAGAAILGLALAVLLNAAWIAFLVWAIVSIVRAVQG